MRAARLSILVSLGAALLCGTALADTRVALVIGNGAYESTSALANPVNDATDIAAMLATHEFDVVLGTNLDEDGFFDKLAEFSRKLQTADVALFYYAGHALQFNDQNYLLPTDARIEDQFGLRRETVALNEVMDEMRQARVNLVFLDACRNNPFADRLRQSLSADRATGLDRGLARIEQTAPDTLIAFAAAAGQVAADGNGRNSPFTAAVLKNIAEPGLSIGEALIEVTRDVREATGNQQHPEFVNGMASRFVMAELPAAPQPGEQVAIVPTPALPLPVTEGPADRAAFVAASNANSAAGWEIFIAGFPASPLRPLAEQNLERLREAALAPAPVPQPPAPEPAPADAARIVTLLDAARLAFAGKRYAEAVAANEEAAKLGSAIAMGDLAYLTAKGLGTGRDTARARDLYLRAIEGGSLAAAYNYGIMLDAADGGFARDADEAARQLAFSLRGTGKADDAAMRATLRDALIARVSGLTAATRRALQRELAGAGLYTGAIDGSFGPASRAALQQLAGG